MAEVFDHMFTLTNNKILLDYQYIYSICRSLGEYEFDILFICPEFRRMYNATISKFLFLPIILTFFIHVLDPQDSNCNKKKFLSVVCLSVAYSVYVRQSYRLIFLKVSMQYLSNRVNV